MLFVVLAHLVVIVGGVRLGGRPAGTLGQTRVVGGLLGPSLFGALTPGVSVAVFRVESGQPIVVMSQVPACRRRLSLRASTAPSTDSFSAPRSRARRCRSASASCSNAR